MEWLNESISITDFLKRTSLILGKVLCIEDLDVNISLDTKLVNGVGQNDFDLSSIDYADFIVLMETEFDFEFDFFVQIKTIGDMYNYLFERNEGNKVDADEGE